MVGLNIFSWWKGGRVLWKGIVWFGEFSPTLLLARVPIFPLHPMSTEQSGAALALFPDGGVGIHGVGIQIGPDRASAIGRRSRDWAVCLPTLVAVCQPGVTVNQFATDQIFPFAALVRRNQVILISRMKNFAQITIWSGHNFLGFLL